ncbi:MAG TPA: S9 family peptidase [Gemmatimonadaceae bacterium]|nr:S9 family peptidase [Gemmatimonadaceae bacterium]
MRTLMSVVCGGCVMVSAVHAQDTSSNHRFTLRDIFELQWAADPQISPDGREIVYARSRYDIMKDVERSTLWMVNADGGDQRPLTSGGARNDGNAKWSPDGGRLAYVSNADGSSEIHVRWMASGVEGVVTHLEHGPSALAWSPDGKWIAFMMFVPEPGPSIVTLPAKPNGADWGPPTRYTEALQYRRDGGGDVPSGHAHIFVVSADGGAPRQLTNGAFNDGAPTWSPDGKTIFFAANRHPDGDYTPLNSEVYSVPVDGGPVRALTARDGPDNNPAISPDGKLVAYTGFDDHHQGYQVTHLYLMNADGSSPRALTPNFDRDLFAPSWAPDGRGLYVLFDDHGDTKIGYVTLDGKVTAVASHVGGLDIGRPYPGGSYSMSHAGRIAFTESDPDHPADVAVTAARPGGAAVRLTRLNDGLFGPGGKTLGAVHDIHITSSFDQRDVEGWVITPPGFDATHKYPLVLEIHGGPYLNYGDRWSAELQTYAAAGYVVLYMNPRGSTSYGETFGNLINHDYPDHDYDDLMSGVDAVIAKGYVDPDQLYVTGGSGGGVLTAWIVGHTHRFRAAVVQKPVINWYSWVLTADVSEFGLTYWFTGMPWTQADTYMKYSPITYVGNVTTPTMMITGDVDYRTPSSEAEQFYGALKLRKVPAALVRVPNASHEISATPSHMMTKLAYVLAWFKKWQNAAPQTSVGEQ